MLIVWSKRTLQALLASARKELEIEAQAHLELAQKIRINLELSLENFILEQKDRRKLASSGITVRTTRKK